MTDVSVPAARPAADIEAINEMVRQESLFVDQLVGEISKVIVGQKYMIERLLIGLISGGHVLLEGVPGLAKTLTVKTLADAIQARFQRLQAKITKGDFCAAQCLATHPASRLFAPLYSFWHQHSCYLFPSLDLRPELIRSRIRLRWLQLFLPPAAVQYPCKPTP